MRGELPDGPQHVNTAVHAAYFVPLVAEHHR
jgi:hypothetical protein